MRHFILILMIMTASAAVAAKANSKHGSAQPSLLPECQRHSALPSPHCGRVPTATFGRGEKNNGTLHVVFSQYGHIYFSQSSDYGKTYSAPTAINRVPEAIYDDGENRPKIIVGDNDEIYVSWTHKTPGRYSGDVRFARSLDGGKHFDDPITVNSDRTLISHRFESMSMDADGNITLIWIDKRAQKTAKEAGDAYRGASLYYVVSKDKGVSFSANKKLVDHSCECCRIASATDTQGKTVALWRHVFPGQIRDHAIAYISSDETAIEGLPLRATKDEWNIEGCPHHGPDLSIDSQNVAHMAWFTQGSMHKGLLYGQFDLTTQKAHPSMVIDGTPGASRPQVLAIENAVYLMWKHFDGKSMTLLVRRSADGGKTWSENRQIAFTNNGSDHPDWLTENSKVYAAWHTQSEGLRLFSVAP